MSEVEDKGKGVVNEGGEPADEPTELDESAPKDDSVAVDMPHSKSVGEGLQKSIAAPPAETTRDLPKDDDADDASAVPFWNPSELGRWSLWRSAIAEFIASFLFLYIGVQTLIGSAASDRTGCGTGVGTLGAAFAFGVTIFVLVYAIAGISGGHINPAITFAMLLVRRVSFPRALLYIIAQVLGSIAGVGLIKAYQKGYYQRYGGGANFVHNGYSKGAGFTAELVGAFFLVYVVFTATDPRRQSRDAHVPVLAPLAIGLTVFVIHLATIPITGTGLSPARAFAAACYWDHHDHAWKDHWIFWVAPLLGATIAAMYYHCVIGVVALRNLDLASFLARRRSP